MELSANKIGQHLSRVILEILLSGSQNNSNYQGLMKVGTYYSIIYRYFWSRGSGELYFPEDVGYSIFKDQNYANHNFYIAHTRAYDSHNIN